MADLDYRILYNGNYTPIADVFEGVYQGSGSGTYFQNVDDGHYNPAFCYLLKNNFHNESMYVYSTELIDINNYYTFSNSSLAVPMLKGSYPLHPTQTKSFSIQNSLSFNGNDYSSIKIENGALYVCGINSGSYTYYSSLPRVIYLEMYGGGGAGGNAKGITTATGGYGRMAAGGGSGGFICFYLDTSHLWLISIGQGGQPSSTEGGDGGNGTSTILKISTSGSRIAWAEYGYGGKGYSSTSTTPSGGSYGLGYYDTRAWQSCYHYANVIAYNNGISGYDGAAIDLITSNIFNYGISPKTGYDDFNIAIGYTHEAEGTYVQSKSGKVNGYDCTNIKILVGAGSQSTEYPGDAFVVGNSGSGAQWWSGHNAYYDNASTFNSSNGALSKSYCLGSGGRGGYSRDGGQKTGVKPDMSKAGGTAGAPGGVRILW